MTEKPAHLDDEDDEVEYVPRTDDDALAELGEWPKLQAQVLRRRLETAGVQVMIKWTGEPGEARGVLLVPDDQSEFAAAAERCSSIRAT